MKHVILMVMLSMAVMPAASQTPAQKPAFEVTSVKPNNSGAGPIGIETGPDGSFRTEHATLRFLLRRAYNVLDYQVVGSPAWFDTARFDVEGKPHAGLVNPDVAVMLQSLLEDRFQLKVHREMREGPVFILTTAKGGPKVQERHDNPPGICGHESLSWGTSNAITGPAGIELIGNMCIDRFIGMLVQQVGRPIIDNTNLKEMYDFNLKFAPQEPTANTTLEPGGASIFTALQEQLGLKLESSKGPFEVLVIDSVQKPSEN